MKYFIYLGFLAGSLLLPSRTEAAEPAPPPSGGASRPVGGQREFGFGPTSGLYSGTGAMIGVGSVVGVWLSGGYMPLFISGNDRDGSHAYELYSSAQGNADLAVTIWRPKPRSLIGLIAGYKLNTHLGHGVGVGVTFAYDLNRTLALRALGGAAVFPHAERELREHGYPRDRDPAIPEFQTGVNLGLAIYP